MTPASLQKPARGLWRIPVTQELKVLKKLEASVSIFKERIRKNYAMINVFTQLIISSILSSTRFEFY